MLTLRWAAAAAAAALALLPLAGDAQPSADIGPPDPHRFDAAIAAFEADDRAHPPPPCPILFVGSSTIRRWTTLTADMAPLAVLNRGFGGSQVADVVFFLDRVVAPYRPRAIVFYAGDNDVNAGRTGPQVVADFERFMEGKTRALGNTPVYFVSIKPSRLREAQIPGQRWINDRIRQLAARRGDLRYIDIARPMLQPDGRPRDLFVEDGLHMTPAGYAVWTPIIRSRLLRDRPRSPSCPGWPR
jgi:lysophospholipase L1-like esterase